ncbi:MAG: hypothetical protein A2912_00655 [Candidatus Buchananbacteria bacterium RIFCSPLOWO2_01_FULL_40_23b]|uniref:Uncharacterized protein n=1 Tax=Candidatus Buchananbacteria bacterium RIFCSPLOWO2_01_FULL_40_23b TaxID=1797544 RepID=A0A1G1YM95_9BACT|nr:MAG: hypothetical protein A2912_00655 [Candidatus Buchananbacteria bacterium RIFCSPLOWO2_01_FULL_40_23b]
MDFDIDLTFVIWILSLLFSVLKYFYSFNNFSLSRHNNLLLEGADVKSASRLYVGKGGMPLRRGSFAYWFKL